MSSDTQTIEGIFRQTPAEEGLPTSTATEILRGLAVALQELHATGQVHRRLVLETVRWNAGAGSVTLAPPPSIVEFGGLQSEVEQTPPALRGDTIIRLPPERDAAQRALNDAGITNTVEQIDLYQFGTLACRLLTGEPVDAYLRSPRTKGKVPAGLQRIVDRALGFNPQDRFGSAAELAAALEDVSAGTHAAERAPTSVGDTDPSLAGNRGDTSLSESSRERAGTTAALPFQRLGHFEITQRIGHGGMGDVYRGYDATLDREVAIKVLPSELSRHPDLVARFHAEAAAAAKLTHPNVVQIYYIGEDQGHHFFAMQHVEGESLAEVLARRGKLPLDEALAVCEQALSGLQAAHERGLIHRDVKPGNILLDRRNRRALLADFGLVKFTEGAAAATATGVIMGTMDYISPEQGRGSGTIDARTDLYSMGVVLYQMLSGELPFHADGPTALIFQHVYEPAPRLDKTAPEVPPEMAQIVARLLEKSPDQRYASAGEVLEHLRAFREGRSVHSHVAVPGAAGRARAPRTQIIPAPVWDAAPILPQRLVEQAGARAAGLLDRAKARFRSLYHRHAPEFVRDLQNTQQQIDGAIYEYERRQRELAHLVAEAGKVARDLDRQSAEWTAAAAEAEEKQKVAVSEQEIATARRDESHCRQQAQEVAAQAQAQREQLDEMRLRLDKVNATLEQLVSQRDVLNARLSAARAQVGTGRTRRKPIRRRLVLALGVCAGLLGTVGWFAFRGNTGSSSSTPPARWVSNTDASTPDGKDASGGTGLQVSPAVPAVAVVPDIVYLTELPLVDTRCSFGLWFADISVNGIRFEHGILTHPWLESGFAVYDIGGRCSKFEGAVGINDTAGVEVRSTDLTFSVLGDNAILWQSRGLRRRGESESFTINVSGVHRLEIHCETPDSGHAHAAWLEPRLTGNGIRAALSGKKPQVTELVGHSGSVRGVAVSPDDRLVASASDDNSVRIWDAATGKALKTLEGHKGGATAVSFSPDGALLASGGNDGVLRLWDPDTGEQLAELKEHSQNILRASFSHDGQMLVSCGNEIIVWDVRTRRMIQKFDGLRPSDVAISPDNQFLAYTGDDPTVTISEITSRKVQNTLRSNGTGWHVEYSPDGKRVICGTDHGTLIVWNPSSDEVQRIPSAQAISINGMTVLSDSNRVVTTDWGGMVKIWDFDSRKTVDECYVSGHEIAVATVNGEFVVAGGESAPFLHIWQREGVVQFDTSPSYEAERRAAEYVISVGGWVNVLAHGQEIRVDAGGALPEGDFVVTGVSLENQTHIVDDDVRHLTGLSSIRMLNLKKTGVGDPALQYIKDFTTIDNLCLADCKFTTLAPLAGFVRLQRLYMARTPVTDAGVEVLKRFKNLVYVQMSGTEVTPAGFAELRAARPECQFHGLNPGAAAVRAAALDWSNLSARSYRGWGTVVQEGDVRTMFYAGNIGSRGQLGRDQIFARTAVRADQEWQFRPEQLVLAPDEAGDVQWDSFRASISKIVRGEFKWTDPAGDARSYRYAMLYDALDRAPAEGGRWRILLALADNLEGPWRKIGPLVDVDGRDAVQPSAVSVDQKSRLRLFYLLGQSGGQAHEYVTRVLDLSNVNEPAFSDESAVPMDGLLAADGSDERFIWIGDCVYDARTERYWLVRNGVSTPAGPLGELSDYVSLSHIAAADLLSGAGEWEVLANVRMSDLGAAHIGFATFVRDPYGRLVTEEGTVGLCVTTESSDGNPLFTRRVQIVEVSTSGSNVVETISKPVDAAEFEAAMAAARAQYQLGRSGSPEFVNALRSVAANLHEAPVAVDEEPVQWDVWRPLETGSRTQRFSAFRFKSSLDAPANLQWAFASAKPAGTWYIMPIDGRMSGFRRYDYRRNLEIEGIDLPPGNTVVFQNLGGGQIQPGAEYIVWFALPENAPDQISLAIKLTPADQPLGANDADSIASALRLGIKYQEYAPTDEGVQLAFAATRELLNDGVVNEALARAIWSVSSRLPEIEVTPGTEAPDWNHVPAGKSAVQALRFRSPIDGPADLDLAWTLGELYCTWAIISDDAQHPVLANFGVGADVNVPDAAATEPVYFQAVPGGFFEPGHEYVLLLVGGQPAQLNLALRFSPAGTYPVDRDARTIASVIGLAVPENPSADQVQAALTCCRQIVDVGAVNAPVVHRLLEWVHPALPELVVGDETPHWNELSLAGEASGIYAFRLRAPVDHPAAVSLVIAKPDEPKMLYNLWPVPGNRNAGGREFVESNMSLSGVPALPPENTVIYESVVDENGLLDKESILWFAPIDRASLTVHVAARIHDRRPVTPRSAQDVAELLGIRRTGSDSGQ